MRGIGLLLSVSAMMCLTPSAAADQAAVSSAKTPRARLPRVPEHLDASTLSVRPRLIVYTGDGTGTLGGPCRHRRPHCVGPIKWTSWTRQVATGTGDDWTNNCRPDCVSGTFSGSPIRMRLDQPKVIAGHLLFGRLRVTYRRTHRVWTLKATHTRDGFGWVSLLAS